MSILETFYILFKSDSTQFKKGAEEVKKSSDQVYAALTGINKPIEQAGFNFLKAARSFSAFIAAGAAAAIFTSNLKGAIAYGEQLSKNAALMGVNIQELDAWDNALTRTGASAGQFESSLKSLAEHMGTSPRIALKVLPQLADTFERLGRFRALHYGKMLGLDENTILFLAQGRREVEAVIKRQRELGVVTEQDQRTFLQFNRTLADFEHVNRSIYNQVALSLIPAFEGLLKAVQPAFEYLLKHKDLIVGALIGLSVAALPLLVTFLGIDLAMVGLISVVGAVIAAFALLYDDIQTFGKGGDSVIGRLIERWKDFKNLILDILQLVPRIWGLNAPQIFVNAGKNLIAQATGTRLNSQTPTSIIGGSRNSQSSTVNIDKISVETTAQSFEGAGELVGSAVYKHLQQMSNDVADGLRIG